ncbi:hypothetical protein Lal_00039856 [Lupinus albus]|nr:hypothetical protein Lal_00039856 [Lupinus albus]
MVRGFSGSLRRDQPFILGCIDILVFVILVIGIGRDIRVAVILECTSCAQNSSVNKKSRLFLDILLKEINTICPVDWNYENHIPVFANI